MATSRSIFRSTSWLTSWCREPATVESCTSGCRLWSVSYTHLDVYKRQAQRCVQAKARAEKEVIWQLGDEVTGPLPKQLVGGNY